MGARQHFIRFVVGDESEHHKSLTGLITEARELRKEGMFDDEESRRIEDLYDWFNANLPVPPFSSAGWPNLVATWFKDGASECIAKMWELVALLREHGVLVRMLKSSHPGRVVYEDDFQVVVDEWDRL